MGSRTILSCVKFLIDREMIAATLRQIEKSGKELYDISRKFLVECSCELTENTAVTEGIC